MTVDSEVMARMYAQVVNGQSKEACRFVTDEETSALWDTLEAEVAGIKEAHPNAQFAIPSEVPMSDPDAGPDDPVMGPESGRPPSAPEGEEPPADEPPEETPPKAPPKSPGSADDPDKAKATVADADDDPEDDA